MLRIALINLIPNTNAANYLGFNHGLAYLSSVLKRDGHQTRLFSISTRATQKVEALLSYRPDAIFVYLTTNQYALFESQMQKEWCRLEAPIFVGGPHATSCPEDLLSLDGLTGVCIGEGETSAQLIAQRIERGDSFDGIPNIWFKREDRVVQNQTGICEENLDDLPFPDRDIFPYREMLQNRAINLMGFEFLTSRGCIYGCRYCINPLLKRINTSNRGVRRRSVDNVLREIQSVVRRYDYRGIIGFHDDVFTSDTAWIKEFAPAFRRTIALPFWCNAHIHDLDETIISNLRKGGCFRVHVGIECGNERIRSRLLNKRISNQEILQKVAVLKKHRMKVVTTFMIGLPDETESELKESIELCRSIAPDWVLLSTFCPYPGTGLNEKLISEGKLDPQFYKTIRSESFYSGAFTFPQETLSQERLSYYYANFVELAGVKQSKRGRYTG